MAKFQIKIDSFLGGISQSAYYGKPDQFQGAVAIDTDMPMDGGSAGTGFFAKSNGVLYPTAYTTFDSTGMDSVPLWLMTHPQTNSGTPDTDDRTYVYCSNGELISYSQGLTAASESVEGTATSGAGNGAAYYNDFFYLATPTDISRFGALSGSPTLTNTVWTGSTLGSQSALTNTAYPALRNVALPNHVMHVHVDNKLYVADFASGQGRIHFIRTTSSGTNDGTTANALLLPFDYKPTAIESYGNLLVIGAIQSGNTANPTTIRTGRSALFFWDTGLSNNFFEQVIYLPDPFITALLYDNGVLYIWSSQGSTGWRLSVYRGGNQLETLWYSNDGTPAYPGGVDSFGNRVIWGSWTSEDTGTSPRACIYAYGSKNPMFPKSINNIASIDTNNDTDMIYSVKYVQQDADNGAPIFGYGRGTASSSALYKNNFGGGGGPSVWKSLVYSIGQPFRLNKLSLNFAEAVATGDTLIPTIYIDEESANTALTTINNTNYASSQRRVVQYPSVYGNHNFHLQLRWTGTGTLPVIPPIIIEGEILRDTER